MTLGAGRHLAVLDQLISDGCCSARVWLNLGYIVRRWRRCVSQHIFQHINPAHHRRSIYAIGRSHEKTALAQQTTAWCPGERNPAKMISLNTFYLIMSGEFPIEKGIISRKKFSGRKIVVEYVPKKRLCFGHHSRAEIVAEIDSKIGGGWHLANVVIVEPHANEIFNKALRLCVFEHAMDLPTEHSRVAEFLLLSKCYQFIIWRRRPQKIG